MGHKGGEKQGEDSTQGLRVVRRGRVTGARGKKFLRDAKDRILEKGKRFDFESLRFETIVRQAGEIATTPERY